MSLALEIIIDSKNSYPMISAEIIGYEFLESIIISRARLTYENRGPLFNKPKSKLDQKLEESLENLEKIFIALKKKRKERKSIEFNLSESKPVTDKSNRIVKFSKINRNNYHSVVEECMILANICAQIFARIIHSSTTL